MFRSIDLITCHYSINFIWIRENESAINSHDLFVARRLRLSEIKWNRDSYVTNYQFRPSFFRWYATQLRVHFNWRLSLLLFTITHIRKSVLDLSWKLGNYILNVFRRAACLPWPSKNVKQFLRIDGTFPEIFRRNYKLSLTLSFCSTPGNDLIHQQKPLHFTQDYTLRWLGEEKPYWRAFRINSFANIMANKDWQLNKVLQGFDNELRIHLQLHNGTSVLHRMKQTKEDIGSGTRIMGIVIWGTCYETRWSIKAFKISLFKWLFLSIGTGASLTRLLLCFVHSPFASCTLALNWRSICRKVAL